MWFEILKDFALPTIVIIVLIVTRMDLKKMSVNVFGTKVDFEKKKGAKDRSRAQTMRQALEIQKRIDSIEMRHDIVEHMARVDDELDAVRGAHEKEFRKLIKALMPEEDNPHKTPEYYYYSLIWDKLVSKLRTRIRGSFVTNGFHDYDDPALTTYIENKLDVLWGVASTTWDKLWPADLRIPRACIAEAGEKAHTKIEVIMFRLYHDARAIRQGHDKEVAVLELLIDQLEKDLGEI